jgi:hypothetical protein
LISTKSMSSTVRPALASALRLAGAGPVSMIVGSAPDTAVARILARARSPSSAPGFSLPSVEVHLNSRDSQRANNVRALITAPFYWKEIILVRLKVEAFAFSGSFLALALF